MIFWGVTSPKAWQKRNAENAKDPKIPTAQQE